MRLTESRSPVVHLATRDRPGLLPFHHAPTPRVRRVRDTWDAGFANDDRVHPLRRERSCTHAPDANGSEPARSPRRATLVGADGTPTQKRSPAACPTGSAQRTIRTPRPPGLMPARTGQGAPARARAACRASAPKPGFRAMDRWQRFPRERGSSERSGADRWTAWGGSRGPPPAAGDDTSAHLSRRRA